MGHGAWGMGHAGIRQLAETGPVKRESREHRAWSMGLGAWSMGLGVRRKNRAER